VPWCCCRYVGAIALAEASASNPVWSTLLLNGSAGLPLLQLKGLGVTEYFTNGPGNPSECAGAVAVLALSCDKSVVAAVP
jgi:hypothetical protein